MVVVLLLSDGSFLGREVCCAVVDFTEFEGEYRLTLHYLSY